MSPSLRRRTRRDRSEPDPATSSGVTDAGPVATSDEDGAAEKGAQPPVRRRRIAHATPVLLVRAAHPRQGLLTAAGVAAAAAISGRAAREVGLVFATVLVGQAILGWLNDLVDRRRDERHVTAGKPIAEGLLDPGTAWFALICGVLLVVPLSVANGVTAGTSYLLSLVAGVLANLVLRRSVLSWLPWAVAFALYPAFLSYGGWGGPATGEPPEIPITVLAALLGVGVHVLCALPGLVADHEDGYRHLPLRIALRIGAPKLLVAALVWTVLVVAALLLVGNAVGLRQ